MADNLSKGRLMLGIGSGANMSDIESINSTKNNNHAMTIEIESIVRNLLKNNSNLINIESENFKISTKEFGNKELGLGYFNGLYKDRDNLEILMPALNENSYNVKLCAKNNWSIVISNFCSEKIIDNHISSYLENSSLDEENALKKIKLSKLMFVHEKESLAKELAFSENSPFMEVIDVIFNKLKKYNKHNCFGENINSTKEAAENIMMFGDPHKVSEKLKSKYKGLSSVVYITVPMTGEENYDSSLKNFAKYVSI